jgi:hypothetical protein
MKHSCEPYRLVLVCLLQSAKLFSLAVCLCGLLGCIMAASAPVQAQATADGAYVIKDDRVIDLRSGVEWLRCSVGQQFDEGNCEGEVLRLSQDEVRQAIEIANRELGGIWRLPTRIELEFLICETCPAPKINKYAFPGTVSEPYWTGQQNWISPKNLWSVNFMTGHSYGRFFPYQRLAVRLVRSR